MRSIELKRCPFCGGNAKLVEDNGCYKVFCLGAECSANSGWWSKKKDAVEAWNRRVNNG